MRIRVEDEELGDFPVRIEESEAAEPGGTGWRTLERFFPRDRTYSYRVPREPGGRRLRVVARDLAGNRAEETIQFTVAPMAPRVKLIGLDRPLVLRAGEPLAVRWETAGVREAEAPVAIRYSRDGGRTWIEAARGLANSGLHRFTPPAEDMAEMRVRVEATGPAGGMAWAESAPITVSATAPRVALDGVAPAAPAGGAKEAPGTGREKGPEPVPGS